ncbi:hypothetical protein GAY31_12700 [Azospirillum brasilense]|nr:hypothetical protein [Azospirillum brasilense]
MFSPPPLRSRANSVCADATGGPLVRRKRGEGRGEGLVLVPGVPRCATPSPALRATLSPEGRGLKGIPCNVA